MKKIIDGGNARCPKRAAKIEYMVQIIVLDITVKLNTMNPFSKVMLIIVKNTNRGLINLIIGETAMATNYFRMDPKG